MKRKNRPSGNFLKIHTLLFTIFVVMMTYTMSATFDYPANASLSFDMFKFFVIERVTLMQLWGVVLLVHFGIHYIRSGWRGRQDATSMNTQQLEDQSEEAQNVEAYPDAGRAGLR